MGKRELLIIVAFVAVGALAYQITAPPPKAGQSGFSLSRIFSGIRREISANAATATLTRTGTVTLRPGVTELRLSTARSVPVTITGERREDIAYELWVESNGPDEATAKAYAGRTVLREDDLGPALALALSFPREGTQKARVVLRVPAHLAVRIENSGRVTVSDVAGLDLRNTTGETTVSGVAGTVTGSHRSGDLTVTKAGAVDLTLSSARARLLDISGAITLSARNGDCAISGSRGPVVATLSNVEFTVTEHAGTIRVSGDGGTLRVPLPSRELSVDVRRMVVEVTLDAATPATIITSDEPLRLIISGQPSLTLDAVATEGGRLQATDFKLPPTTQDRESRLSASLGAGGTRVVLRNTRGDIVISQRK